MGLIAQTPAPGGDQATQMTIMTPPVWHSGLDTVLRTADYADPDSVSITVHRPETLFLHAAIP